MTIEKNINGNFATLKLEGWLDTKTSVQLAEEIEALPANVCETELDFEKLEYISSAGIRQIIALYKKMDKLTISNVSADIMDVFKMIGLDKRLNIQ